MSRPWYSPRRETFEAVFDTVYRALAVAVCAAAASLPLPAAFTVLARPAEAWPFLLLCALPVGPAVAAAFWCFQRARDSGELRPFRDYWIGWRRMAGRAFAVWGALSALLLVLAVDAVVLWGTMWASLLGPLLAVLGLVAVVTAITALAGLSQHSESRLLAIVRAALFLSLKRWPLSVLAVAILGAWALVMLAQPVLGVLGLGGFALYALWSGAAATLAGVGAEDSGRPAAPAGAASATHQ